MDVSDNRKGRRNLLSKYYGLEKEGETTNITEDGKKQQGQSKSSDLISPITFESPVVDSPLEMGKEMFDYLFYYNLHRLQVF